MLTEQQILDATVLIVDDEPVNVLLLERTLERAGYSSVRSVTDSREFASVYEASQPDIVLLDLTMPYLDGFQILERLKAITFQTIPPVLVLTAQVDRESRLRSLANGAKDFLTKPFDTMEVLLRIRNLLETHLLQRELAASQATAERLLLNILPRSVAQRLMHDGGSHPVAYSDVSILFADFEGFSRMAWEWQLEQLIQELEVCFNYFDKVANRHRLERLKTIGDGYMCAGGIPEYSESHAMDCVLAGFAMEEFISHRRERFRASGRDYWSVRIGVHTGPVIAGVIGKEKFAYDVWGSTVNIAKRIESNGRASHIAVSSATYERVRDSVHVAETFPASLKNVGEMSIHLLDRLNLAGAPPLTA